MWSSLKNYSDAALLFVRVALGALILSLHAWPRLVAAFGIWGHRWPHPHFWHGAWSTTFAVAETLASLLLILGRWTRPACLLLAIFVALAMPGGVWHGVAAHSDRELDFILLLLYSTLFFVGPGRFSLDKA
jgi:putative oxidoreductase